MSTRMDHDEIAELLGAYALDAVDDDERAAVEAHLVDCARCRAEVAEHRDTASLLAHGGSDAPAGLWDRIAGSIESTGADQAPPPLRLTPGRPGQPVRPSTTGAGGAVVALPRRWAAVALAAAAALLVVLGVQVVRQGDRIDELEAATVVDPLDAAFEAALDDPSATVVELAAPDGTVLLRGAVTADGTGYLRASNLPALADARTYQLWGGTPAGDLVSLGVLGADPGVVAFDATGFELLAISEEDVPGVVAPTADPVVAGALTS